MPTLPKMSDYGKSPNNPLRLKSIPSSRKLLDCLVTEEGLHIVYHRLGSIHAGQIVDHYEIMDSSGRYDDIYISIYNEKDDWIPPAGYLFEERIEVYWFDSYDGLDNQEVDLDPPVDQRYIWKDPDDLDWESPGNRNLPPWELVIFQSYGETGIVPGFPFPILKLLADNDPFLSDQQCNEIMPLIQPRTDSPDPWIPKSPK